MKQLLTGSILSGIAVMIWGFAFWAGGVASLGLNSLSPESEAAVMGVLGSEIDRTGTYILPDPDATPVDVWTARHLAGPLVTLHITQAGADPLSLRVYLLGFLHMTLMALLIGLLLRRVTAGSYRARVAVVLTAGVLVAFWGHLSGPIWFYQPWGYHMVTAVYDLVAMAIMGLIMARFTVAGE